MERLVILDKLQESCKTYWAQRLLAQLQFADAWFEGDASAQALVEQEIRRAGELAAEQGALTKADCLAAEARLGSLSASIRELTVYFAAHAHIDMNWMWGYQETAAVTLDTFRTMLDLMREYPDFTFSQSQASVYKIVEELEPEMIAEIRQRIHEGRWELTASTWVETDKNMPDGESFVRHIQYTRDYLSKLFDIDPASLDMDFEPDTFGHTEHIPELLSRAGIKYYYHCRGYDKENLYRWESPSGAQVMVYREPVWYNADIMPTDLAYLPKFCRENGLKTALKVYGVGDHGGGPTRRDVERIRDMAAWPLMPTIRFGTFHDFFRSLEPEKFPVVRQELNFVFTGCYTTQSRIKLSNRLAQVRMNETEALTALRRTLDGVSPDQKTLRDAWERILFNHFHDIIPGSCVIESREFAMGRFQEAMAGINTQGSKAMRAIAAQMNTAGLIAVPDADSRGEGGGVGFGTGPECGYHFPQTERGGARERLIHLFNPTQYRRHELTACVLWDYQGDTRRMIVTDTEGNVVKHELREIRKHYWGHFAYDLLIDADVPAFGYRTYVIREEDTFVPTIPGDQPRVDRFTDDDIVLDNGLVCAVFARETMLLKSFVEKRSGRPHVTAPTAGFRRIIEDPVNYMTAWRVGYYTKSELLNERYPVMVSKVETTGLRKCIQYSITFGANVLDVTISLDAGRMMLDYDVKLRWMEVGSRETGIPQIKFDLPLTNAPATYLYDEPCGVIERPALAHDVPAQSFMAAVRSNQALVLACDTKYGFRGDQGGMGITLVRSAYDPDPLPEIGDHCIRIGVGITGASGADCLREAVRFCQPMAFVSGTAHEGTLPCEGSGVQVEGVARVSVWKAAEDGNGTILRLYSVSSGRECVRVTLPAGTSALTPVDLSENDCGEAILAVDGAVSLTIGCGEVLSYRLN